jgi:hypothetical protein
MSNNSKSGFELRTDILGIAQGILNDNREQLMNNYYNQSEETRGEAPVIQITSEDVIAEAQKLYAFVNEKV